METTELIHQLGIRHRAPTAYRTLFTLGLAVVPVAHAGLRHANAEVRASCCALLDHFWVPEALGDLIDLLSEPAPQVRQAALHTLACDRCKQGTCRPVEAEVLPAALRILHEDTDPHVCAMALRWWVSTSTCLR